MNLRLRAEAIDYAALLWPSQDTNPDIFTAAFERGPDKVNALMNLSGSSKQESLCKSGSLTEDKHEGSGIQSPVISCEDNNPRVTLVRHKVGAASPLNAPAESGRGASLSSAEVGARITLKRDDDAGINVPLMPEDSRAIRDENADLPLEAILMNLALDATYRALRK